MEVFTKLKRLGARNIDIRMYYNQISAVSIELATKIYDTSGSNADISVSISFMYRSLLMPYNITGFNRLDFTEISRRRS